MSGEILPTLSKCTNLPVKWNALILYLFPLHKQSPGLSHDSLSWLFAEHSQSVPCFRFCPNVPRSPLRCGHIWSGCTTLWSEIYPWYHHQRYVESSGCFELEYHQSFCKTWSNISARCVQLSWVKRKSNERTLHACTLGVTARNLRGLLARKFSRMPREDGVTFHPKEFTHATLVLAWKNKVEYFLKAPRMCFIIYFARILLLSLQTETCPNHAWNKNSFKQQEMCFK